MHPEYKVAYRQHKHPLTKESGWTTELWQTNTHENSKLLEEHAIKQGWTIYLVANKDKPGIVVYRKN